MTNILENERKTKGNVQQPLEEIVTGIYGSLVPEPIDRQIVGQIWKGLSGGQPVKPKDIANSIETTPEIVNSTVKRFGADFDSKGNIVGHGLTLVPTPHIYKTEGHTLYTWCAGDALAFPVVLRKDAIVEYHDPVTKEKIHLKVSPEIVEDVEPKDAVVSFVKSFDPTNIRTSGCNKINFFASPQSASKWMEKNPDMMLYSVNELFQGLKDIHLKKYNDFMVENNQERRCC